MTNPFERASILSKYGNVLNLKTYQKAVDAQDMIQSDGCFVRNGIMYAGGTNPIYPDMRMPGMDPNQRFARSFGQYLQDECGVPKEDVWKAHRAMGEVRASRA
jgi:hypothetical protein